MTNYTIVQPLKSRVVFFVILLGNILDHYDTSLYVFLAPYLADSFLNFEDPVIALITTYGLLSFSSFTRSLGIIFFSSLVNKIGSKKVLFITLSGMAITTFIVSVTPTYKSIGIIAPIILTLLKMIQAFFAAGEVNISSILILNYAKPSKLARANGYYQCSTMLGILFASAVTTIVSMSKDPGVNWRFAFALSILTGVVGLYLRFTIPLEDKVIDQNREVTATILSSDRLLILKIACLNGVSYITYSLAFILLNQLVPLISSISYTEMLIYNNALMYLDIIFLLVISHIIDNYNYNNWMLSIIILLGITIVPCFSLLPNLSLVQITAVKSWIILLGVAFTVALNAWLFNAISQENRYLFMGVGYVIGVEILGRKSTLICLLLWKYFDNLIAPAIYVVVVCIFSALSLVSLRKIV